MDGSSHSSDSGGTQHSVSSRTRISRINLKYQFEVVELNLYKSDLSFNITHLN